MAEFWAKGLRGAETTPKVTKPAQQKLRSGELEGNVTPQSSSRNDGWDTNSNRALLRPPSGRLGPSPQQAPKPSASGKTSTAKPARLNLKSTNSQEVSSADASAYDSPRESIASADVSLADEDFENDNETVQVFVRIRPSNTAEISTGNEQTCVSLVATRSIVMNLPGRESQHYTFDQILPESSTQDDVFEVAGMPMVDNCMAGYNSSIFAYGQTGAGKTYTMLGVIMPPHEDPSPQRGLAPRVFQYLFQKIAEEEDLKGRDTVRYSCKCSMLEIYNENITDLLNPSATGLQIREDHQGCFVDGLSEVPVLNVEDVVSLMRKGADNRHVGETRLNRESSRSHSVFTCSVEKSSKAANGVTSVICSRLNLIDLAGSERIRSGAMGGSQVQGEHFKEAVHINKSLTTLGRVIMELVEAQRNGKQGRHIPYRDSRLTFLLQDSLGGNARTMIIANISPSMVCGAETSSTLRFVQRAKKIRNRATINLDYRGDVSLLQKEILRLEAQLEAAVKGAADPAIRENKELKDKLREQEALREELELKVNTLTADSSRYKRERARMEEYLTHFQSNNGKLDHKMARLNTYVDSVEQMMEVFKSKVDARESFVEEEVMTMLQDSLQAQAQLQQQLQEAVEAAGAAASQVKVLQASVAEAEDTYSTIAALYASTKEKLAEEEDQHECSRTQRDDLQEQVTRLEQQLEQQRQATAKEAAARKQSEAQCRDLQAQMQQLQEQARDSLTQEQAARRKATEEHQQQLAAVQATLKEVQALLAAEQGAKAAVTADKASVQQSLEQLQQQLVQEQVERQQQSAAKDSTQQALEQLRAEHARVVEEAARQAAELAETQKLLDSQRGVSSCQGEQLQQLQQQLSDLQREFDQEALRHQASVAELREKTDLAGCTADQLAKVEQEREQLTIRSSELENDLQQVRAESQQHQQTHAETSRLLKLEQAAKEESLRKAEELQSSINRLECQLQEVKATQDMSQQEAAARTEELTQKLHSSSDRVAELEQQLQHVEGTLDSLQHAKQHADEMISEQAEAITRLKQDMELAEQELQAAGSREDALRTEKTSLLTCMSDQLAQLSSLKSQHEGSVADLNSRIASKDSQIAGLHTDVVKLNSEMAHMHGQLEERSKACDQLRSTLDSTQQKLTQATADLQQVRKALDEAKAHVSAKEAEVNILKKSRTESELQLAAQQKEQHHLISSLQKEIIQRDEQQARAEYDLKARLQAANSQLEALRKEQSALQQRLEDRAQELERLKMQQSGQSDHLNKALAMLAERDRELSDARKQAAKDQEHIHRLQQEINTITGNKGDLESQMKSFVATTTRQNRAFTEIRRLIEWATTPPTSARSSMSMTRTADGTPISNPPAPGESTLSPSGVTDGHTPSPGVSKSPRLAAKSAFTHRNLTIRADTAMGPSPSASPKSRTLGHFRRSSHSPGVLSTGSPRSRPCNHRGEPITNLTPTRSSGTSMVTCMDHSSAYEAAILEVDASAVVERDSPWFKDGVLVDDVNSPAAGNRDQQV